MTMTTPTPTPALALQFLIHHMCTCSMHVPTACQAFKQALDRVSCRANSLCTAACLTHHVLCSMYGVPQLSRDR
jgi:hypothetical protein